MAVSIRSHNNKFENIRVTFFAASFGHLQIQFICIAFFMLCLGIMRVYSMQNIILLIFVISDWILSIKAHFHLKIDIDRNSNNAHTHILYEMHPKNNNETITITTTTTTTSAR